MSELIAVRQLVAGSMALIGGLGQVTLVPSEEGTDLYDGVISFVDLDGEPWYLNIGKYVAPDGRVQQAAPIEEPE